MNTVLKQRLPANRNYDQVLNHYLVERSIAERLKSANREQRKEIFATMYDELFSKVPDHPRLTRRMSDEETLKENKAKLSVINRFVNRTSIIVEFAPGDCRLSHELSKRVDKVYGVDISDQRNPEDISPDNFVLIIYDGYSLPEVEENSCDLAFSFQMIEHLHPEDTLQHFTLVRKILKPGGSYIFQTPHSLSGPYDISAFFSDEPEGFHLKEWTYTELRTLVLGLGYSAFKSRISYVGIDMRLPNCYFSFLEEKLQTFPKQRVRRIAKRLIPMLYASAVK